jgi:hypothetical protein
MLLTCVFLRFLTLIIKCEIKPLRLFFDFSSIVIKVCPNCWLKQKSENYYKFISMNVVVLWNFLLLTFTNYSKNCGCFNPLSIKQIKRAQLFEAFLKIKKHWKKWKKSSFVFLNKKSPSVTFKNFFLDNSFRILKLFFL